MATVVYVSGFPAGKPSARHIEVLRAICSKHRLALTTVLLNEEDEEEACTE